MGHVIVIRHETSDSPFEAHQDDLRAEGPTLGVALDRLLDQLGETDEPLILVRQGRSDRFFTQAEFDRLQELMARNKGQGEPLRPEETAEMEALIDAELLATTKRAEALLRQQAA